MQDFETLSHDQQLPLLRELAGMACTLFDIGGVTGIQMVNLSENATFRVDAAPGESYALRIHRYGYHARAAIASELAWLVDLRENNFVTTPRAVRGLNGDLIQNVQHPRMLHPRHVVLFEWEQGCEPGIGENLTKPFEALGAAAARMHDHVLQWQKPNWFTRHTWNFETALGERNPHWGRWREGLGVNDDMRKLFARTVTKIGERLSVYGQSVERFGLVHGDLRLANLLVDGETIKVIDFDDCGFGWFMYDAATPLSFYEHEPQVPELIEHWKAGYRSVRPLTVVDENEIPTFIMFRRLLLVAWIGTRRDTDLAKSMGQEYSIGTVDLCERYLTATD
jgi:Ser/Thr protein kinase RdoA (MazF antagonist)